jgi:hypothetical protein
MLLPPGIKQILEDTVLFSSWDHECIPPSRSRNMPRIPCRIGFPARMKSMVILFPFARESG